MHVLLVQFDSNYSSVLNLLKRLENNFKNLLPVGKNNQYTIRLGNVQLLPLQKTLKTQITLKTKT